jgi:ABC-type transport system involved in multi-copper enzyme maturation permease subunit
MVRDESIANRRGKPFLEFFALALKEDYRFPTSEIFVLLFTLGTFVFSGLGSMTLYSRVTSETAYTLTSSALSVLLFVFILLILKNIAYGLGSDIEKGIVQTYFSYPLKRRSILSAKLLSALCVSVALFLGAQILSLYILAPDVVAPYFGTVLLTYAASLCYPLLIAGVVLLVTLVLRRGGLALIMGIVLYFVLEIVQGLASFVSSATGSALSLQVTSVFSPSFALARYFEFYGQTVVQVWVPSLAEVVAYVGAGYAIVVSVFLFSYFYISRRMSL